MRCLYQCTATTASNRHIAIALERATIATTYPASFLRYSRVGYCNNDPETPTSHCVFRYKVFPFSFAYFLTECHCEKFGTKYISQTFRRTDSELIRQIQLSMLMQILFLVATQWPTRNTQCTFLEVLCVPGLF